MAKIAKKKDESPILRMVVENGRLVPAFPFEAERLASYRNGTKVIVSFGHDRDRPLVRKWFAVIGWYLKNTDLPWGDKDTASAAMKLALTLIEPFKMPSGQWAQYPKSLSDIDDTELENKIREMQQILYEITGVDQETMRQNGGTLGDEPFETTQPANDAGEETLAGDAVPPLANEEGTSAGPDVPPPAGTGATDSQDEPEAAAEVAGDYLHEPAAAEQGQIIREGDVPLEASNGEASDSAHPDTVSEPASGGPAPVDETEAREEPSASSAGELSAEERIWLKQGAKMMLACLPSADPESLRVLVAQVRIVRDLVPKGVSDACLRRMEIIRLHTVGVCKGQHKLDVSLVAKTALCSVADVTPEPVKVRQ